MELKIKVDGVEMSIDDGEVTISELGTSPYGFKFDENCPTWEKSREHNEIYLKLQQGENSPNTVRKFMKGEKNMIWFIVYLLVLVANIVCLLSAGIETNNPRYWVSIICVMLAYFAGRYGG